jgi:excisionase family DNA binding protein
MKDKSRLRTPWYSLSEAAEYLRCSERHLRNLSRTGKIEFSKSGGTFGKYLYHRRWLDTYLFNNKQKEM